MTYGTTYSQSSPARNEAWLESGVSPKHWHINVFQPQPPTPQKRKKYISGLESLFHNSCLFGKERSLELETPKIKVSNAYVWNLGLAKSGLQAFWPLAYFTFPFRIQDTLTLWFSWGLFRYIYSINVNYLYISTDSSAKSTSLILGEQKRAKNEQLLFPCELQWVKRVSHLSSQFNSLSFELIQDPSCPGRLKRHKRWTLLVL